MTTGERRGPIRREHPPRTTSSEFSVPEIARESWISSRTCTDVQHGLDDAAVERNASDSEERNMFTEFDFGMVLLRGSPIRGGIGLIRPLQGEPGQRCSCCRGLFICLGECPDQFRGFGDRGHR